MGVSFDSAGCINVLRKQLILTMKHLQQELLAEAKQGMRTPEGADSLHDEEITDIANVISVGVAGGAWAAMDEFGTGSLMDTSNTVLDVYKNSPAWNPARRDNKIRTRPNQQGQVDIFGNPINGRGAGGFDLEAAGKVNPTPPSRAIATATRWMANGRMREAIQSTIKNFPFGKFIIVSK